MSSLPKTLQYVNLETEPQELLDHGCEILVNMVTGHWQVETVARVNWYFEVVHGTKCREEKLQGGSGTTRGEALKSAVAVAQSLL